MRMTIKNQTFELIEQTADYPEFRHSGCDKCADGLGNSVYMCNAWRTLTELKEDAINNAYRLYICNGCIYEHRYGERPD